MKIDSFTPFRKEPVTPDYYDVVRPVLNTKFVVGHRVETVTVVDGTTVTGPAMLVVGIDRNGHYLCDVGRGYTRAFRESQLQLSDKLVGEDK